MDNPSRSSGYQNLLKWLAFAAICTGIAIRLAVYLQNRNLMIDEANVARNIYERGFSALALSLSYHQYAPPVWLWGIKLSSLLFGFSETALRLLPLLSGILSLVLLHRILKTITSYRSLWYPILLLATGFIFIRYSTELKQYATDACISLALIQLALTTGIDKYKPVKFATLWTIAGTIAIWASMPSVFVLAGIGCYYAVMWLQNKDYTKVLPLGIIVLFWVAQFALYYATILQPQIDTSYLQNFHKQYFLTVLPVNSFTIQHNAGLIGAIIGTAGGENMIPKYLNGILIAVASIYLLIRKRELFALLIVPFLLLLLAASANQYTLIPRVTLFIMPVLLILIGYGLHFMLQQNRYAGIALSLVAIYGIVSSNALRFFVQPLHTEQLTDALSVARKYNLQSGNNVYIHNGAKAAFIYYSTIHPGKNNLQLFKNAHFPEWNTNYDSLAINAISPAVFVFTSIYDVELEQKRIVIGRYMHPLDSMQQNGSLTFVYSR